MSCLVFSLFLSLFHLLISSKDCEYGELETGGADY